jgi:hypothetical protein
MKYLYITEIEEDVFGTITLRVWTRDMKGVRYGISKGITISDVLSRYGGEVILGTIQNLKRELEEHLDVLSSGVSSRDCKSPVSDYEGSIPSASTNNAT